MDSARDDDSISRQIPSQDPEGAVKALQAFIGSVGVAFWEYDPAGPRVFGLANHEIMFGVRASSAEWTAARFVEAIDPSERERTLRELVAHSRDGAQMALLTRIIWPDGSRHWIHLKGIGMVNEVTGQRVLRGLAADLTKLKEAEEELRESQLAQRMAEEANRAKSMFLAGISHELRTPLHGILTFAQFARKSLLKTGPAIDSALGHLEGVLEAGQSLNRLILNVLDWVQLESGTLQLDRRVTDLGLLLKTVTEEFSDFARERSVELRWVMSDAASSSPPNAVEACIDAERIRQVLRCLLTNAIQFASSQSVVEVSLRQESAQILLAVQNEGVGIAAEELGRIFDKFVQGSRTRGSGNGTGLGLTISREIVRQHGGQIRVESVEGGQTRFMVELPRERS